MKKTIYNKLIRDGIPEIMDTKGVKYSLRTLEVTDIVRAMADKVVEEATEVHDAVNDRVELIKEIADLQEILAALMNEK
jgi:predicted house-cleaning noncanonical NTP pyrophosphatase (MazG superfamily)